MFNRRACLGNLVSQKPIPKSFSSFYCFWFVSTSEFSLLRIFRVALLFICQGTTGSFADREKSNKLIFHLAAPKSRNSFIISRAIFFVNNFFEKILTFSTTKESSFERWTFIISQVFPFVNNLFAIFIEQPLLPLKEYSTCIFLEKNRSVDDSTLLHCLTLATKRRKRDLNPRAGCPTYTLSRGASSAS